MTPEIKQQQQEDVQRMKDNLAKAANLRNLALEDLETQKALVNGMKKMKPHEVIDQAQQLENSILPKILAKHGAESAEYKFWKGVLDSMNWLLHITDYSIRLEERIVRLKHNLDYYQRLTMKLERELDHYTTLDRVMTNDLIHSYTQPKI